MSLRATLLAAGAALSITAAARTSDAECADGGAGRVALTSGLGVGAGATGALGVSGILAAADDSRDFHFGIGAAVGIGVTAGLTGIYAVVDASTDCAMVTESDGVVWSIPIVMAVVGSLLPVAVWGASDETGEPADTQQALRSQAPAAAQLTLRF